jgi:DNA-binding transcriptional LysR family regulator
MQIKLPLVLTFLTVAEMRSFRRAAEVLNTTQPNISGRIAELEALIGQSLFYRSGGTVALTPRGQTLMPYAENVREAQRLFEQQAGVTSEEVGTLRVSASESLVDPFLIRFLEEFASTYPRATVDLQIESTTNQRHELVERRIDLSFLMGPVSHHSVTNIELLELPVTWIVATNHPLARRKCVNLAQISESPIISFSKESRPYAQLLELLQRNKINNAHIFSSNSLNASIQMARAVEGICTVPRDYVQARLATGEFHELDTSVHLDPLVFSVSFHRDIGGSLASQAAGLAVSVASKLSSHHKT